MPAPRGDSALSMRMPKCIHNHTKTYEQGGGVRSLLCPICRCCAMKPNPKIDRSSGHKHQTGRAFLRPLLSLPKNPVGRLPPKTSLFWSHFLGRPAQYSPGSALSVENHFFGPWVCQSVLGARASPTQGPHRLVWPGFHTGHPHRLLGAAGGQSQTGFQIGFINTVLYLLSPAECHRGPRR